MNSNTTDDDENKLKKKISTTTNKSKPDVKTNTMKKNDLTKTKKVIKKKQPILVNKKKEEEEEDISTDDEDEDDDDDDDDDEEEEIIITSSQFKIPPPITKKIPTMTKPISKKMITINPSHAKSDPLFWTTYQSHLRKSLSLSRRIQAFDTAVYVVREPGFKVAENIYMNDDGISVNVHDDQEHNIPDFELYTARIEELCKHSGEKVSSLDGKVDQIIHSPAFVEVSSEICYYQKIFQV